MQTPIQWCGRKQIWRQWENWCWYFVYWWVLTVRWEHEILRWRRRRRSWEEEQQQEEEEEQHYPLTSRGFTSRQQRHPHWWTEGTTPTEPGESRWNLTPASFPNFELQSRFCLKKFHLQRKLENEAMINQLLIHQTDGKATSNLKLR